MEATVNTRGEIIKVPFGEKVAYGIGDVGSNLVWATLTSFVTFFYTDVVGITPAIIGSIMMISRFFDGASDIAMGVVIDKTETRFGKARPWLLVVAVPYGISAVLLFSVPDFELKGKIIYAFITYNLLSTVFYTMYNMPYGTLSALMTQDQQDRSVLTIIRMFCGVATALLIGNITMPLINRFGGGSSGWQMMSVLYGASATVIILITFFKTEERIRPARKEKIPVSVGIKALLKNKYWRMVLVLGMLTFILFGLPGANIYYVQYVLRQPELIGTVLTATFTPNIIVFLFLPVVVKRFGKRNTSLLGYLVFLFGSLILIKFPHDPFWVVAGTAVKGIGFAPIVGTLFAFVADTIEYGEWKTGVRTEGLLYSAASFGQKVGIGLSLAMIGWVLQAGKYTAGVEHQSSSAIMSIKLLFIHIPVIVYTMIAILLLFYKLDKEYPEIVEKLRNRPA